MKREKKKARSQKINEFLLHHFFMGSEGYDHDIRDAGKYVLVKSTDGNTGRPMVSIYTQESYLKSRNYIQKQNKVEN